VSKATVYRHVETLAAGGILEIAEEYRVRGAVERAYRLRADRASLADDAGGAETPQQRKEEYRRAFAVAMAALAGEFYAYLEHEDADPAADLVGFRQHAVWLDRDELTSLIVQLRTAITPRLEQGPGTGRGRYLLSPILFPTELPGDD
jgi:hypothetical protein